MRTILTVLGVSVGIGAVLFLVSLGYGLQQLILNRISTADSLLTLDVSSGTSGIIQLDADAVQKIKSLRMVKEVSPLVVFTTQITMGDLTGSGLLQGIDMAYFRLGGIPLSHGGAFTDAAAHEAVISSAAVELFGLSAEEIIGKMMALSVFVPSGAEQGLEEVTVVSRADPYKIVGVVDNESNSFLYVPLNTISDINIAAYEQAKVRVADSTSLEPARAEIVKMGFFVSALSDTIDQAKKIFKIVQIVLGLFGLVALIVSAIGMFNTMTVTLLERINEIGIMRAVGMGKSDIWWMFICESLIMGFLGGMGGVLIGYLGGTIANFGINILAKNFGGQELSLFVRPMWFMAVIVLFSTFIGAVTGIFPARRAAKMHPLDALRYK